MNNPEGLGCARGGLDEQPERRRQATGARQAAAGASGSNASGTDRSTNAVVTTSPTCSTDRSSMDAVAGAGK